MIYFCASDLYDNVIVIESILIGHWYCVVTLNKMIKYDVYTNKKGSFWVINCEMASFFSFIALFLEFVW